MIFATNNKSKLKEIRNILTEYQIYSLKDKNIYIDVIEDKDTFYENAYKKAKEIYGVLKEPVIADDSGLCIDILDDFPGVMTHRFLGNDATDMDRNKAILEKMKGYIDSERKARFICNLVYYDGINTIISEGILYGRISENMRGENGFGFDPIFELDNGYTLAELSDKEKNSISARYLAIQDLNQKLKRIRK